MVYLTRRYRFSAGHRLHNDAMSAEENRRVYGKCNNPNGHGHNYILEVTVAGAIDPATGMIFDLGALDGIVAERVLDKFDHKNLNLDMENFRTKFPPPRTSAWRSGICWRRNLRVASCIGSECMKPRTYL